MISIDTAIEVKLKNIRVASDSTSITTLIYANDSTFYIERVDAYAYIANAFALGLYVEGSSSALINDSIFNVNGSANTTGVFLDTTGSIEFRDNIIKATDLEDTIGATVKGLNIVLHSDTKLDDITVNATSAGANNKVYALRATGAHKLTVSHSRFTCEGTDTTDGCIVADNSADLLLLNIFAVSEGTRACSYADNNASIRTINSQFDCADSGSANGGTVFCKSVYNGLVEIADACG